MRPLMAFLLFVFFVKQSAFSQSVLIDSLTRKLPLSTDKERADILNRLTLELISQDNSLALKYNSQSLTLSNKIGYTKGEGVAYSYKGVFEYLSGEYSDGRDNLRRGLQLSIKAGDRYNQAYTLLQLGNSYLNQSQLDSSLLLYDQAYVLLKDSLNPIVLSKLFRNMSALYGVLAQYDLQEKYLLRCLKIRELAKDQALIEDALLGLASVKVLKADYKAADQYFSRIEKILEANPPNLGILNYWRHQKGLYVLRQRKFDEAMVLFDSAKAFYTRTPLLERYVSLQLDIGRIFYERGEYELALKNFYEGLRVAEVKNFKVDASDLQLQLGWVNYHLGEYGQSIAFADAVLGFAQKNNILNSVADALTLQGVVFTQQKAFDKARKALSRVLEIREELKNNYRISEALMNLGYLESACGNFEAARKLYSRSVPLAEQSKHDFIKAWSLLGLGEVAYETKQYENAIVLTTQAEKLCKEIQANEILIRVYELNRDILAAQNHFKESLHFSILAYELKDSLHRSDLARRFINLQKLDEIEKRDLDINALTKDKQLAATKLKEQYILIYGACIVIVLVGVLAFVYARYYFKTKRLSSALLEKNKLIEDQKEELTMAKEHLEDEVQLRTEELTKQNLQLEQFTFMTSHNLRASVSRLLGLTHLFNVQNPLDQINQLVIEKIKISAKEFDVTMRDLTTILEVKKGSDADYTIVGIEDCLQKAKATLRDEMSQVDLKLSIQLEETDVLGVELYLISIFSNLISNSINFKKEGELRIAVSSRKESGKIVIEYADNGSGFDMKAAGENLFKPFKRFHLHKAGKGLGLYMIKLQLEAMGGTISLHSAPGEGFNCCISLQPPNVNKLPGLEMLTRKNTIPSN